LENVIKNREHTTADGRVVVLEKVKNWTKDLLKGLDFLHDRQVAHLDVRPENIFLTMMDRVKLGDLAMFRNINAFSLGVKGGETSYLSPEIISGTVLGEKADIWSFGCVLYEILMLEKLFKGNDLEELYAQIKSGTITLPDELDKTFKSILNR
jgi:serine/threonine protein kinase